jgi:hypothetical protein
MHAMFMHVCAGVAPVTHLIAAPHHAPAAAHAPPPAQYATEQHQLLLTWLFLLLHMTAEY